jgi:hypothetical protein
MFDIRVIVCLSWLNLCTSLGMETVGSSFLSNPKLELSVLLFWIFFIFCLHIYFQWSFFIISSTLYFPPYITCSCPYPFNHIVTAGYMCHSLLFIFTQKADTMKQGVLVVEWWLTPDDNWRRKWVLSPIPINDTKKSKQVIQSIV